MSRKKEGRGFFIALLTVSGIAIFFMWAFFFKGREITVFTYKQFVINKAFVSLLPKEYNLEKTEAIRKQVYDFYDQAGQKQVHDTTLMQVSRKMQGMMDDEKITDEEVVSLMALIEQKVKGK